MKMFLRASQRVLALSVLFLSVCASFAQLAVVTIKATDPVALESGKPATITVFRSGPTNFSSLVYYKISGTASNGVDYKTLGNFVTIPAGVTSSNITIQPLIDTNVEGTLTVILTLTNSPLMIPVNYEIGSPSSATAYIFDDDDGSNLPPVVNIVSPSDGATFSAPANIPIIAQAFDPDGSVSNVEFFANGKDLGPGHIVVLDPPGVNGVTGPVYFFDWQNVSSGDYALTAVATDNGGLSTTSAPVNISVLSPAISVKITSPTNGAVFIAPVNIPVSATASSSNADIVRVTFFADDHFIGTQAGTNLPSYDIVWSNALPGFYTLRAVALDSSGAAGVSPPVFISVIGTVPPPTNPPVVTIYALDPIAVVGTNCLGCYSNSTAAALNFRSVTNTATFIVRRAGETNDTLTVDYSIGGTASNGVDYVTLPGSVTIPAGLRYASIVVDPLNEGVPECPETVILTLEQPTNVPPAYIVGWPDKATALIIDCQFPPPATSLLCSGLFHFGQPPANSTAYYILECSQDLIHWIPVCTNTASVIGTHFTDADSPIVPARYYRVISTSTAPPP